MSGDILHQTRLLINFVNITLFFISFRVLILTTLRLEFIIIFCNQQEEKLEVYDF